METWPAQGTSHELSLELREAAWQNTGSWWHIQHGGGTCGTGLGSLKRSQQGLSRGSLIFPPCTIPLANRCTHFSFLSNVPKRDNTHSVGMAWKNTNPRTKEGPTWHYKHPMKMPSFVSSCLKQSSGNPTPSSQYSTGGCCSPQPGTTLGFPTLTSMPWVPWSQRRFSCSVKELRHPSGDIPQAHPITLASFIFLLCSL